MASLLPWIRFAVLGAGLCLVVPGGAAAQFGELASTGPLFGPESVPLGLGYADLVLVGSPFLVGQIVAAARGKSFPPFWAWAELTLVGAPMLGMGFAAIAVMTSSETVAAAMPLLAFGSWFATHAILNIARHHREARPDAGLHALPTVAVVPGGVLLGYARRY